MPNSSQNNKAVKNQLGTFGGVFTPSILTILGVIMFMRSGFVIGQAGIFYALIILLLSKSITTITSLSISAVSTNTPVAGGGAYFLISRALGPEFGGAIGIVLFSAQTISIPFYILGFSEALIRTFPAMAQHMQTIALVTTAILFIISYVGANWAIKTQYLIMTILGISIIAFLTGALLHFDHRLFQQNWAPAFTRPSMSFWSVFAIYFPAVTGIMAGVNMSGDLKDPGRSIPRGTFLAIGVGFMIYCLQVLICGGAQTRLQLLESSFDTLREQALWGMGFFVVAGVFAATLSSALGSFLGAPRVMQAVAKDGVVKHLRFFQKGTAKGDEPRRALILTFGLSLAIILLTGNDTRGEAFNVLASIVTMFFLYTYGLVNLAAFAESFAANPSFRPRFRYYHWIPSLVGALACAATAFLIDAVSAVSASIVLFALYTYLRQKSLQVKFGDARWGFYYSRLRSMLLRLARTPMNPKNWRPIVLVMTGNPENRHTMTLYALWFGETRGMVILARVIVGDIKEVGHLRGPAMDQLENFLKTNDFHAMSSVVITRTLDEGLSALLQGHPIGPLQPNLVLMGWSSDPTRCKPFVRHMNTARLLGMGLILLKDSGLPVTGVKRRIDIWWRGRENGSLMVLLAHLLTLNWEWSQAQVRLIRLIQDEAGRLPAGDALRKLLDMARMDAEVTVLVSDAPFQEVLYRHSCDASVVFLGFNVPEEEGAGNFQRYFDEMIADLPTTLLVCASGETDLTV